MAAAQAWINRLAIAIGALTVVGGVGGLLWLGFGGFNAAASSPHTRMSYWAIHAVMIRAVQLRAQDIHPPEVFGPRRVIAGFRQYDAECVRCHGAPGVAREAWADWMNPSPPYLLDAPKDWSDAELFWIVCHGAKMTGMPAWGSHRSDDQIWDLVAFLRAMPYVNATGYQSLRRAYAGPDPAGGQTQPDASCLGKP